MKEKLQKIIPILICVVLCLVFGGILMIYASPMEDVSIDLSLIDKSSAISEVTETPDEKGWEVYTREGDVTKELEPDGRGFYLGIELGQTLYLSRVLEEDMDAPTLQIGSADRTFVVFLDDQVIYSDHPELDSRIGYLSLPMGEYRQDPVTITLPSGYQGKTLTIAQSTPPYSEGSKVKAAPASVILHCGYAYESGIISESYSLAITAAALFAVGLLLLVAFVRRKDWSLLCIALTAFLAMCILLNNVSFHFRYFGSSYNYHWYLRWLAALSLLAFLTLKAGSHKRLMQVLLGLCAAYTPVSFLLYIRYHNAILGWPDFLFYTVPEILFLAAFAVMMVLGIKYGRKENRFYRVYTPLLLVGLIGYWGVLILRDPNTVRSLYVGIISGSTYQLYRGCLIAAMVTALAAALWDALQAEVEYRTEKHLIEQRREMTLASYENLRRQHEEVMMLRHDMLRHFRTLHDMGGDKKQTSYLAELIGQTQKIRPIVESGNEMLDIILNGRLGAAVDAGIRVEIPHVTAPAALPLSDPDLCALIMNIVDNAIAAAAKTDAPYIKLKVHEKQGHLGITCENSFDPQGQEAEAKNETVPKHGLGLKIVHGIVAKYQGAIIEEKTDDHFIIKIAVPLL